MGSWRIAAVRGRFSVRQVEVARGLMNDGRSAETRLKLSG